MLLVGWLVGGEEERREEKLLLMSKRERQTLVLYIFPGLESSETCSAVGLRLRRCSKGTTVHCAASRPRLDCGECSVCATGGGCARRRHCPSPALSQRLRERAIVPITGHHPPSLRAAWHHSFPFVRGWRGVEDGLRSTLEHCRAHRSHSGTMGSEVPQIRPRHWPAHIPPASSESVIGESFLFFVASS